MTEFQRLFLVQARSDFQVFEMFRKKTEWPACHALHYLQMATEKLGKAYAWKHGPRTNTHRAFVTFLRALRIDRQAQKRLGYEGKNAKWLGIVRKSVPLAESIEDLAPSLSPDKPNPEYPWPRTEPRFAPVEHQFQVWQNLIGQRDGQEFLRLLERLFAAADAFL